MIRRFLCRIGWHVYRFPASWRTDGPTPMFYRCIHCGKDYPEDL